MSKNNYPLTTTGKSGGTSHSSTSTSKHSYGGSSYDDGWGFYSIQMDPTLVFKAHGIEFWGAARDSLRYIIHDDDIDNLSHTDLIVNCSGQEFKTNGFVKMAPDWVDLPESDEVAAQQVLLDWKDMSPPPAEISIDFWEDIVRQAKQNGITRIISCCGAGQGRTGTALSAFLMATGVVDEPDDAISYVRDVYSKNAVETQGQEIYVFSLIYDVEALIEHASQDEDSP
ncbi:MAG: protein-tyrosine phosphatase family protein [Candidatus Thorarchaeota archaeon]|jgi:hypothetical protein